MADNTILNANTTAGDSIRDLARAAGTVKTQVVQLDLGGVTANAEILITAGQQLMAVSVPVVLASNQTPIPINIATSTGSQPATTQAISAAIADAQGTATTASGTGQAIASVANSGNATFHLVATAFVGTLVFEASLNGGVNYGPVASLREDGTGLE